MKPLVQAVGVEKCYVDGPAMVRVLTGADLEVAPGERIAIVGQSGVGKSTFLHLVGVLDRPTAGRILIDGIDVLALDETPLARFRNATIGFVFQSHQLLGDFTAVENVMFPLLIRGVGRGEARRRAFALLDRVGLASRATHRPGELSGGEQQRVAIARAIIGEPKLLLADEPTGNLDPATGATVQNLLLELNREMGTALIVVTHNARLADAMDRRFEVIAGRLVEGRPALHLGERGGRTG